MAWWSIIAGDKISDRIAASIENGSLLFDYTFGNVTLFGQAALGGVGIFQAICSGTDAFYCTSLAAKPIYLLASISSTVGAVASFTGVVSNTMVLPISAPAICIGIGCRKGAKYLNKVASSLNPLPGFSDL